MLEIVLRYQDLLWPLVWFKFGNYVRLICSKWCDPSLSVPDWYLYLWNAGRARVATPERKRDVWSAGVFSDWGGGRWGKNRCVLLLIWRATAARLWQLSPPTAVPVPGCRQPSFHPKTKQSASVCRPSAVPSPVSLPNRHVLMSANWERLICAASLPSLFKDV